MEITSGCQDRMKKRRERGSIVANVIRKGEDDDIIRWFAVTLNLHKIEMEKIKENMSNGDKLPPKSYYTPGEVVSATVGKRHVSQNCNGHFPTCTGHMTWRGT